MTKEQLEDLLAFIRHLRIYKVVGDDERAYCIEVWDQNVYNNSREGVIAEAVRVYFLYNELLK